MSDYSYLVGLPVPPPFRDRLSRVQEHLRPPGWRITIGPHITLVPPGAALADIQTAVLLFSEAVRNYEPLILSYPTLGEFHRRGLATVFLKPIAHHGLFELRRRLVIMAAAWQDTSRSLRRPFVPHVTLVNRLLEAEAPAAMKQLAGLTPLEMELPQICLFAKRSNDQAWLQII